MTAFLSEFLHWIVMALGILAAWFGVGLLIIGGLARWFRMNSETDPDLVRDKSIEFYSSAGGE